MQCYILVGGRSSRMGRSKTELFLDRVVDAAVQVFDRVIAVQRADDAGVGRIDTIHEPPHEDQGPIFGIERALEHADSRCAILAVDYPLVTPDLLRYLRDARPDAPLVVPVWNGRAQPLCAVYDPAVLPLVRERISKGRRDLGGLLAEAGAAMIPEDFLRGRFEGEPLLNVNTQAELNEAEALYGK